MCDARTCAFVALLAFAPGVEASTVVARSDGELIALADRVVHARVLETWAEAGRGQTVFTVARLAVIEDFTGHPSPEITVHELGGRFGGRSMHVSGAATYAAGDDVLVCLEVAPDGHLRSVAMAYSRFSVAPNGVAATRAEAGLEVVGTAPPARSVDEFRRVAGAIKGVRPVRHPGVGGVARLASAAPGAAATRVSANFTLLSGGLRWNEADLQQPVEWRRNAATPAPVEIGDVDVAAQLAIDAWTDPPSASLLLTYAGTLDIGDTDPYCGDAHAGRGLISFEDPTFEIPSGTIAVGGGCADAAGGKVVNGTAFERFTHGFVVVNNAASLGVSIRTTLNLRRVLEHEVGHGIGLGHTSVSTASIMFPSCCAVDSPVPPALGADDLAGLAFIYPPDVDGDTLPDDWERQFGLDPVSGAGDEGAGGDADGDGLSNAAEFAGGTHPRGLHARYFAEGAASAFFETAFGMANPSEAATAHVLLTFTPTGAAPVRHATTVAAARHRRIVANDAGLPPGAEFATLVESDEPVAVDRVLTWNRSGSRYGAHAESAIAAPSPTWYFAEGATHSGFAMFLLLQNPNAIDVQVDVTYLRPSPQPPVTRTYGLAPLSRRTVWVNAEDPQLSATDVSASLVVRGGAAIVAERAMYLDRDGVVFEAGHAGAGAPALAGEWFFAEGRTGDWFDEYLLLANPGATAVEAAIRFMTSDGTLVERDVLVPASARVSIDVERVAPALADAEVAASVHVRTGGGLVVERALWWGGPYPAWVEAHDSLGAAAPAARWVCASGEAGGAQAAETFVLIANIGDQARDVRLRVLAADGAPSEQLVRVAARSRFTAGMQTAPGVGDGEAFGVVVESVAGGAELVVERAIYWSAGGPFRAGAANVCTPMP